MTVVQFNRSGSGWTTADVLPEGLYIQASEEPMRYWVLNTNIGRVAVRLDGTHDTNPFTVVPLRELDENVAWCGPVSIELVSSGLSDPEDLGSLRKAGQALHLRVYDGAIGNKELRLEHVDPYLHREPDETYGAWKLLQQRSNGSFSIFFVAGTWPFRLD